MFNGYKYMINFEKKTLQLWRNEGDTRIKLLPIYNGGSSYFQQIYYHFYQVNGKWVKHLCIKKTIEQLNKELTIFQDEVTRNNLIRVINYLTKYYGTDCYCCEKAQIEKDKGNTNYKNYYAKKEILVKCVERGKENDGVKILTISPKQYDTIITNYKHYLKEIDVSIFDIYKGYDIILTTKKNDNGNLKTLDNVIIPLKPTPLAVNQEWTDYFLNEELNWESTVNKKNNENLKTING